MTTARAQTRPPDWINRFEHQPVKVERLRFSQIPDSTRPSVWISGRSCGPGFFPLFPALSNSGSLLVFADSLARHPVPVEKRRHFPFVRLVPGKLYELELSPSSGEESWFAARLLETEPEVRVIDEIWVCFPLRNYPFSDGNWKAARWIENKSK